ncbi:Transthyretin-like family protein [Ancylostoma caninum]|uniref:Transthyretin-like family protein n=1 Tax=Ancylostoma caninum TaxID=29170 RepID=A0A368F3Z1_ANCCA|nr:Transthyretin-like family protein [Ancylostoma caninum]
MRAIVLLLLVSSCYGLFRTQSVAAKGQLRCNNKPEAHSMVELKEKELIRKDLWLNSSETGTSGNFYVIGTASDVWSISPYLTIYHKCPKAVSTWLTFE